MSRVMPLLLLPLAACGGSVTAEALDDGFGIVWESVRMHFNVDGDDSESIVISNNTGVCNKTKVYYEALEDYFDVATDFQSESYCEDVEDEYVALADASAGLYYDGAKYLSVSIADEFEAEDYEVGTSDADASGYVTVYDSDYYSEAIEDFDPDSTLQDNCGVEAEDDELEVYVVVDGELVVSSAPEEGGAGGRLEGELENVDGDEEGDIVASFSAAWCEVDVPEIEWGF